MMDPATLANRRVELRNCESRVTAPDGSVRLERRLSDGSVQSVLSDQTSSGFVINETPDLAVGRLRPHLCFGSQDAAYDLATLVSHRVTHVLNVATGVQDAFPGQFQYCRIPLLDLPEADLLTCLSEAFEFVESARRAVGNCLVHCNAGISRSAAVVVAYLMHSEGLTLEQALLQARDQRRCRPNEGFMKQLKLFQEQLDTRPE